MQFRRLVLLAGVFYLAGARAQAQQANAQAPPESSGVIRAETRLVLVDTVVMDKKGNYLHDLTGKDFRVWEDNREQEIKSFSFEADANAPAGAQRRYLVLFFDNSTMEPGDQVQARQAAAKFIDSNVGPNRLVAIVNFGGSVHIAQNFTGDAERLKKVVSGVKFSSVSPNAPVEVASLGMPQLGGAEADFGARSVILALRTMAKNLASVPGRKTLVLFTSGFPMTDEYRSELTATIDACNKANVAVYPIDARGLVGGITATGPGAALTVPSGFPSPRLLPAAFRYTGSPFGNSFMGQRGGGGAGGGWRRWRWWRRRSRWRGGSWRWARRRRNGRGGDRRWHRWRQGRRGAVARVAVRAVVPAAGPVAAKVVREAGPVAQVAVGPAVAAVARCQASLTP